jgi:arginase family enzyme
LQRDFKLTGADLVEVAPFVTSYKKSDLSPEPETTLLSASVILNKIIESMHGSYGIFLM